jgi:hypothetical protein
MTARPKPKPGVTRRRRKQLSLRRGSYHYRAREEAAFAARSLKKTETHLLTRRPAIILRSMSERFAALALLSLLGLALVHCGGTVVNSHGEGSGGSSGHAGQAEAGRSSAGRGTGGSQPMPRDAGFDEYVDPGCPDAGPAVRINECDPFAEVSRCPPGEGCYPFVDHPFGAGCDEQTFGTQCLISGVGMQGDTCGAGGNACAAGFVCVVGSEPGKHCVELCLMSGQNSCPRGMICTDLDVEGFGVCT